MVLGVLYFFDPATHGFYPGCLFHKLTGLDCPGCGGLRAAHHLLHGEFAAAFRYNPLLVVSTPVLLFLLGRKWIKMQTGAQDSVGTRSHDFYWVFLLVLVIFGIVRNLPFAAFAWMSP